MPSGPQSSARAEHTSWRTEAERRGYGYRSQLRAPGLPGLFFRNGTDVEAADVADALKSIAPFIAGTAQGTFAEETLASRVVVVSFVGIPLGRPVPSVTLVGGERGILSHAGLGFSGRQRVPLGAASDSTFTLYCTDGDEHEALALLTQPLLAVLAETAAGCDVELVDEWMFIYGGSDRHQTAEALSDVARAVERIVAYLPATGQAAWGTPPTAERTISPAEQAAQAAAEKKPPKPAKTSKERLIAIAPTAIVVAAFVWYFLREVINN